jgi:hypothetical protein
MNLADWLKSEHSSAEQITAMLAIARALGETHNVGSCHGDAVAPAHIEIASGQARFMGGTVDDGESPYRAPELAKGPPSPSSDVFSAGAIFYEIMTGRHPYAGESLTGVLVVDFEVQPEHLRHKRSDVSGDLADAVMACLEKDPEWRAKDLDYVVEMLQKAQATSSGRPRGAAASASPRGATVPPRATASPSPQRRATASSGGRSPALGIIAAIVVLGGAGAGWYFLGRGQARPTDAAPPSTLAEASQAPTPTAPDEPPLDATPVAATTTTDPTPAIEATAEPTPTATPAATPTPTPPPRSTPTPPPTPTPTPVPAATPPPTTVPALPLEPAVISHLSPPTLQRRPTAVMDIRGNGLRADHKPLILKDGKAAAGLAVSRQKYSGPDLIQLLLTIDGASPTGTYTLRLVDGEGLSTNNIEFKLEK